MIPLLRDNGAVMLRSDLIPEIECARELVELTPAPNHVQRAWCSHCGTEFYYLPDSTWVTIVSPGMRNEIE